METVIFGGPDKEPESLARQIKYSVEKIPKNGTVSLMSYYFYNRSILLSLINLAQRGAHVEVLIEKQPRSAALQDPPDWSRITNHHNVLIDRVSKTAWWNLLGFRWHPHCHEKVYYFSHPKPYVYIGSYNPSDDPSNSSELTAAIGDHSISHNVLVKITEPSVVNFVGRHCSNMHHWWYRALSRFWPDRNSSFLDGKYHIYLWPRLRNPFYKLIKSIKPGDQIQAAVSHLKGPGCLNFFIQAQRRGADVHLLLDSTERRVPESILAKLNTHQIRYTQLQLPSNCLMHCKFMLLRLGKNRLVVFGSVNWSTRSQWLNHEIAVQTNEVKIVEAFEQRWAELVKS